MKRESLLRAAHDGYLTDREDILPVDRLLCHWGEPHSTDGTPCFCLPTQQDGVVLHRRMPWENPQRREGAA